MKPQLSSPRTTAQAIAELFAGSNELEITISVREDRVFKPGGILKLGKIHLQPMATDLPGRAEACLQAILKGFFEIHLSGLPEIRANLDCVLEGFAENKRTSQLNKAAAGINLLVNVFTRVGLIHPQFDADAIDHLPLKSPATIIMDTSAILGGGIDFAARFLYPISRIKIPGIVNMEIVNEVDNYFSLRRESPLKAGGEAFVSHSKGLGGQGVLLRLELQNDLEIERSSIFQEPLRHAFSKDKDTDSSLSVAAPVRSYCDRLILEATRMHQSQVSPGHPIFLMTSDQGLARMAMSEGFSPLFCEVMPAEKIFPSVLSGVMFHPFSGALYGVSLPELIWELATSYGTVLLQNSIGAAIEVATVGNNLTWQTFHARKNLRWMRANCPIEDLIGKLEEKPSAEKVKPGQQQQSEDKAANLNKQRASARSEAALYKFSAGGLLVLLQTLVEQGSADRGKLASAINVKEGQFDTYLGFLRAGGFINIESDRISPTDRLLELFEAMRRRDFRQTAASLMHVTSFARFLEDLDGIGFVAAADLKETVFWRMPNYRRYGESCGRLLMIPGDGLYATKRDPDLNEFVSEALLVFENLSSGGDYVLTGKWLEGLAQRGIHPLVARERLQQAQAAGLLERFTRGATPDTRFEDHEFHKFDPVGAGVALNPVHLYHGDFLIPERTSVEIRLQKNDR